MTKTTIETMIDQLKSKGVTVDTEVLKSIGEEQAQQLQAALTRYAREPNQKNLQSAIDTGVLEKFIQSIDDYSFMTKQIISAAIRTKAEQVLLSTIVDHLKNKDAPIFETIEAYAKKQQWEITQAKPQIAQTIENKETTLPPAELKKTDSAEIISDKTPQQQRISVTADMVENMPKSAPQNSTIEDDLELDPEENKSVVDELEEEMDSMTSSLEDTFDEVSHALEETFGEVERELNETMKSISNFFNSFALESKTETKKHQHHHTKDQSTQAKANKNEEKGKASTKNHEPKAKQTPERVIR